MTCHQDKGWGFSLPPLLFPLNLMKKKGVYGEIHSFVQEMQPHYQMKDGLCLGALRTAQQKRVKTPGLRKAQPRGMLPALLPIHLHPWSHGCARAGCSAPVMVCLVHWKLLFWGSRGKKCFYQSHRKHCYGSVGWADFCPKSLTCFQNRAGKNKGKGSAAQPDQLLEVKAKSFMGKGSGCFIRGGGERAFPQNAGKNLPAILGAGCWALEQHEWLSAAGAGKDSA